MSFENQIKIEENLTTEEDLCVQNSNGHLSQQDYPMVTIKTEIDDMDTEAIPDGLQSCQDERLSNIETETNPVEDIQIKDEITIEEAKVEQYSEFHLKHVHSEEKLVRCRICFSYFKGASELERHTESEHRSLGRKCKICSTMYKKGELNEHKDRCAGRLLYVCDTCEKRFVKMAGLWKHLDDHGLPEDLKKSSMREINVKENIFLCTMCNDDRAYKSRDIKVHTKEEHDCPACGKTFKNSGTRGIHMMNNCKIGPAREGCKAKDTKSSNHNDIAKKQSKKSYQCNICERKFTNAPKLRYHKIAYHGDTLLSCSYCSKKFVSDYTLKKHLKRHTQNPAMSLPKFENQNCLKSLTRRIHYRKIHLKEHDQEIQKDTKESGMSENFQIKQEITIEETNLQDIPQ